MSRRSLLLALVVDRTSEGPRGPAFDVRHLACGSFLLAASQIAGILCAVGRRLTSLLASAAFTFAAASRLLIGRNRTAA